MRAGFVAIGLVTAACSFHGHVKDDGDAGLPIDTPPTTTERFCRPDAYTKLCFGFDDDFVDPLPNEGSVATSATLGGVTRVDVDGRSGARFGANTGMTIDDASAITNLLSLEVWFRADELPPASGDERFALFDNSDHISAFYYHDTGVPVVRCEFGESIVRSLVAPDPGRWIYLACVCNAGNIEIYLDGVKVTAMNDGSSTPCSAAVDIGNGITIGHDNDDDPAVGEDALRGVIDGIRLWSSKLAPSTICAHAGRTGC